MYAWLIYKNKNVEFGGLVKKYFGKMGEIVQWLIIFELITICIAYIALAPDFFSILFNINSTISVIIFLGLGVIGVLLPMRFVEFFETLGLVGIILLIGIVGWFGFVSSNSISWTPESVRAPQLLLLFGPLLFALSGRPIIARIVRSTNENEYKYIPLIIVLGTAIPAILYGIYTLGILAINPNVNEHTIQTISLFPPLIALLLALLGIIALWTSYFVIARNVRDELVIDAHINKKIAFLFTTLVPVLLYFAGINNFIRVISFAGGIFLAFEGFFVVRMWQKERNKKDILFYGSGVLYFVFFLAIIQEIKQIVW